MVITIKRKVVCLLFPLLFNIYIQAQNSRCHIVGTGETLQTIAQQYGVSEDEIKNANPTSSRVFYVGMKLVIPEKKVQDSSESSQSQTSSAVVSDIENHASETTIRHSAKTKMVLPKNNSRSLAVESRNNFNGLLTGLVFGTDLSEVVGLNYGVFANVFVESGWGAYASLSTNIIAESGDDLDFIMKIGPSYMYGITSKVSVGGAVCYTLTSASYYANNALISGVSLMPNVGYSFGTWGVSLSLDCYFRNGYSGMRVGPYLGVTYSFK